MSIARRRDGLLTAALRYAGAGWPVFPCKPGAKVPAIGSAHHRDDPARSACRGECGRPGHGFLDATTDLSVIRSWWARWPDANVALATGAPVADVLDVDRKPEGSGFSALSKLIRAGLTDGARALVRTRSGGLHIYFTGTDQGCHSLPRHFLDFKACGGYVLAPPSWVGADDKGPAGRYELLDHRPGTARLDWRRVAAVLDPPRRPRPAAPGTVRAAGLPPGVLRALEAPVSDRSAALHRLIGACVRAGLDEHTIHEIAADYEPALAKYGPQNLHREVDRSLTKIGTP